MIFHKKAMTLDTVAQGEVRCKPFTNILG